MKLACFGIWTGGLLAFGCQATIDGTGLPTGEANGSTAAATGSGGSSTSPVGSDQSSGGSTGAVGRDGTTGSGSAPGQTSTGGGDLPTGTGPYCDVLALMQARCVSCHASPPLLGVPMPLVTAADLLAESPNYPGQQAVEASIARMQDPMAPMPPAPAAPATPDEVATLQAWIDAGTPTTCDSGAGGAGGAPSDPYDTPVTCTSMTQWTGGNRESPNMRPGGACIDCHTSRGEEEGPAFTFAGTVYPSAHEPDDCNGVDGSGDQVEVVVVDANGTTFTVGVNSVGNFFLERGNVALPYRAKVVAGGRERVMASEQESGDCNVCHTESGAMDAPGRIMAP